MVDILHVLVGKMSKKEANVKKSQHFTSTLFEEGVKLSMLTKILTTFCEWPPYNSDTSTQNKGCSTFCSTETETLQ